MIFEEMMRDERNAGRIEMRREDILNLLEELDFVPKELRDRIEDMTDMDQLRILHKKAAKADSMEQFLKEAEEILTFNEIK